MTHAILDLARMAGAPVRELVHLWRRSIQARVVLGTLFLSAVLSLLAGWVVLNRVTDGLLESKQQAAISQTASGVDTAQATLDAARIGDFVDGGQVLANLVEALSPRNTGRDDFYVAITPATTGTPNPDQSSRGALEIELGSTIPPDLLERVESESGIFSAYTTVHYRDPADPAEPGLVVSSQIRIPSTNQLYSLDYVFPLHEQQQTLHVVRGALITAGSLLAVLLGTIAWLVTRQVVRPVRLARRIAERLAAGRLEERMHVRGEDDIARLGVSFNQMATSLQRQIRQLEELSRVQRRFVADVSHELRTPLTTVRMAADVLYDARTSFEGATARSAELLQTQLDRFELLLTDLLEISRFDAGAAALELSDVDLTDLAHRVVDATCTLAEKRGSKVVVAGPPTPVIVQADVRRIERVVRNLVVNAIEYGEGRDVEVAVASNDDAVALSVRDHGVGLRPGEDVLVFNRFWRADPARARTRGGTGLGLSIAVEDTVLHSGRLDAWGEIGVGSLFRLTLPRRTGGGIDSSPLPLIPREKQPAAVGGPYARFPHDGRRGLR